jgi:hypothetical protein
MKNKTKTELTKMTKKNLLLHIEKIQLLLENDHLETQKTTREMKGVLSSYSEGTAENKLNSIRSSAGKLRYEIFYHDFSAPADRKKIIKMVDNFMNSLV